MRKMRPLPPGHFLSKPAGHAQVVPGKAGAKGLGPGEGPAAAVSPSPSAALLEGTCLWVSQNPGVFQSWLS